MKTIRIILLAVVFFIFKSNYGQSNLFSINQFDPNIEIIEMGIDSTFYSSGLVCSITDGPVSGLSVTADIKLYSYEGYIRILLCDLDHEQDYLVYEAYYPLNRLDTLYHIEDYAYESNIYNLSDVIVRVEIHNGECYFNRMSYYNTPYALDKDRFEKEKRQLKKVQDSVFLSSLNQRIKEEDFLWIAGATSISELYYDQRKEMLPKNTENEIPNLQGLEYYKGGVFEVFTDSTQSRTTYTSNYVDEFDWRKRHGENWLTPSRTQDCNHCWVFCPISVAESSVNLYFNQHINYDLSEQHVASCNGQNQGNCLGSEITYSLSFLISQGVVLETCFPYQQGDFQTVPCSFCGNPSETISFNSYDTVLNVVDSIKKAVIENGPICGGIESLWHYMPIVGFKTLKVGDTLFYNQGYNSYEIIQPNDPRIGQTCWLFKNSKGVGWGNNGCAYFLPQLNDLYGLYKLVTPESLVYDDSDIVCEDRDGDGYYNWGIGPKPATCPNCPDEPDCDDSDPTVGPYGEDYNCISICDIPNSQIPMIISESETWNKFKYIRCNIEIVSPATLTITSKIWLNSQSKIIVHPGAKLVIDGGILTNPCQEMWQGIEVWGDSSTHQYEINGSYAQGYVELKNGATIENAICAVELWRPGHYGTTGGIIHARDATFRNNAKAVHALNYSNVFCGTEDNYSGFFRNCTFTVDEDYIGPQTFYKHVDLASVKGLRFLGCSFSAERGVSGVSSYCMGIDACSASFVVNSYCDNHNVVPCPEADVKRSSFAGFYQGIHASNSGNSARSFNVRDAVFNNNTCGVYALNTGFATIVGNDFIVGCNSNCNFGIYADGVSAFCIEENTFQPKVANTGSPYGVAIVNSQGINDVYRNEFRNLRCGNVAIGNNTDFKSSHIGPIFGLTYTCNTNSGNLIDFCVLKDGNTGDIATQQGSATMPAGNTFGGSQYHFYNDGNQTVTYYYDSDSTSQTPNPLLLNNVGTQGIQVSNSCVSHYGGGAVPKSVSEKAALASDFLSARSAYESLLQLYESRIDGGSTPTQVADINNANPSDMWSLRAQLLGLSPYLSGEVLTTAANRTDVFTDPVLFEILVANPDELKNDSLISYLENKEHPLPAYMTDLLKQIASGFTPRTALLGQMGRYGHDYRLAAGDIVRSSLSDSVTDMAELRTWLGNMGDIASDRMIVASYLQEGDSTNAFALANMLPELYGLHGEELDDHADYMRLIGLYQTLYRGGRTVFELTETELDMVENIATSGTGTSKAMADALLGEILEEHTRDYACPTMPGNNGGNRGMGSFSQASLNQAMGFTAGVSPNPASTWATVAYTLPAKATSATISLTNTLGISVATYDLAGNERQKVLDLRGLADGVYMYTIQCGEYIASGKLIITK